jgi:hypothetical protein
MVKVLHPQFLEGRQQYAAAEQYWKDLFDQLAEERGYSYRPYINNNFGDGTPMMDGNPIFSAYSPKLNRAVRVIQHEPEDKDAIVSWTNDTEWEDGTPFTELVISLVLTEKTAADAQEKIRDWFNVYDKTTP